MSSREAYSREKYNCLDQELSLEIIPIYGTSDRTPVLS